MRGYVTTSDKEAAPRAMLERWEVTVYQKWKPAWNKYCNHPFFLF